MPSIANHLDILPMRMLGENVKWTRSQWLELYAELKPGTYLHERVGDLLEQPVRRKCAMGYSLKDCALCDGINNCYR